MSFVPNNSGVYVIISNIPKTVRSNQLRKFFSSFVESCGFICFHYIHRPEAQKPLDSSDSDERNRNVSHCCIVKVVAVRLPELFRNYNRQNWLDGNGETLPTCCLIKKIKLTKNCDSIHGSYRWTYRKKLPADREEFSIQEVESFHEMYPPFFMPNGNVGTPTDHFLNEFRMGRLSPSVIRKLGLPYPRSEARGIYSSVAVDFMPKKDRQILKKKLKSYNLNTEPFLRPSFYNRYWHSQLPGNFSYWDDMDYKEILYHREVEWDPYETLQDDFYGQERFIGEKVGLEWKKGSGLVFYPDAQYWNAQEGFFNAKTSDDWDIDPQIYQEQSVDNDTDISDLETTELDKRSQSDTEVKVDKRFEFAGFEKYNKGIGSKILEALGWKKGQGIGKNGDGIAEPLPNEGQFPSNKKGFGYQVVKLDHPKEKSKNRCSDDPKDSVSPSCAKLKYRKEFLKETI